MAVAPSDAVVSAAFNEPKGTHCLPRVETVQALMDQGAVVRSTSNDGDVPVVWTVSETGGMSFTGPADNVFAWDTSTTPCASEIVSSN